MTVTSGTIYRFTNAQFPSKALNVYASGTTISARRNVCLYTNDTTDVMQQWVPVGNETDGYFLKCSANQNYALHYATGADSGSCVGNADVKSGIAKAPTEFLVDFIYLGNNQVKIKRRNSNEYLTAYNDAAPTSNTISTKTTNGNVYWTADDSLGNKQVWNVSPSIDEETIIGNQNLIMPVDEMKITCGYKVPNYLSLEIGTHYGVDYRDLNLGTSNDNYISDNIIASGEGYIYRSGWDNNAGYFACIVYPNAYIKTSSSGTRHYQDITVRYWHMNSLSIPTVSDYNTPVRIHKYDPIGTMGKEGKKVTGIHVHIECDTDTTPQYTFWSPTHWASPNILQNGTDSTINPGWVFQKGSDQTVLVQQDKIDTEWVLSDDYSYLGNVTIE